MCLLTPFKSPVDEMPEPETQCRMLQLWTMVRATTLFSEPSRNVRIEKRLALQAGCHTESARSSSTKLSLQPVGCACNHVGHCLISEFAEFTKVPYWPRC